MKYWTKLDYYSFYTKFNISQSHFIENFIIKQAFFFLIDFDYIPVIIKIVFPIYYISIRCHAPLQSFCEDDQNCTNRLMYRYRIKISSFTLIRPLEMNQV